ncbi:RBPJ-interacting and tubulin-associated protein 1 [Sorex fumeus]|uniref:RBPJ-interacting and tubulin-associated protein 1 n=1 Tax=Sorex fumeus TaxID=62283 RepID=UPI0024ACDBE2|nr:RBPJ-interacting and tubulin-associated protein 1 [Sorex fumeus]
MKALHPLPRARSKARASYVDETLFGSPGGSRPTPPDFDPPWVQKAPRSTKGSLEAAGGANGSCAPPSSRGSTPTLTPRKKNKYRLIGHTPSYCDESLFGSRPGDTRCNTPWLAKGDTAKLHALCWTPPATPPRGGHPPRPRGTPLRAVHPPTTTKTEPRASTDSPGVPAPRLGSPQPPRRGRSHSLTHLNVPSSGQTPWASPQNGPAGPRPFPRGVTIQSALVTPRARSASVSVPTAPRRGGTTQNQKPPWK